MKSVGMSLLLLVVAAWSAVDAVTDSYLVDCSLAQYDYANAGRAMNATYGAKTRSECVSACEQTCGTVERSNLDCLKADGMAGCSYFVKMTRTSYATLTCREAQPKNGVEFKLAGSDFVGLRSMPVSYSLIVQGFDSSLSDIFGVYGEVGAAPNMCQDAYTANIPVSCDSTGLCEITDVIATNPHLPPSAPEVPDFYVSLYPTYSNMMSTGGDNPTITYLSAGMVTAVSATCASKTNCEDCAAAKCHWCNNTDASLPASASGYRGCGVAFDECEHLGYAFDFCVSGALRTTTGLVSSVVLTGFVMMLLSV